MTDQQNPEKIPVYVPTDSAAHDPFHIESDATAAPAHQDKQSPKKLGFVQQGYKRIDYKLNSTQRAVLYVSLLAILLVALLAGWWLFKDILGP